ncbi:CU044_5270 family protein [Kitasatospora sp. NPDC096147]|uniref:CU044_5270 family protein n=1 Tax=Kitasatospora sp. NPDC096147 TaxID=3364093 RepID=UPI003828F227
MNRESRKRTEPLDHAELARLLPAPSASGMPIDRQLLFEEHLLNEIQASAPAPAPVRRPARRALLIGAPVAAAALAAVLAVGGVPGGAVGPGAPAPSAPAAVAAQVVPVEPGSALQLASTVRQLSAAAGARQVPVPGPGQYVYVKSEVSFLSSSVDFARNESRTWVQPLHRREVWQSVDGLDGWLDEPGYLNPGGIGLGRSNPHHKPADDSGPDRPVDRSYDWLKAQPADPDALLPQLYPAVSSPRDRDQQAFEALRGIVNAQLVPAPVAAALYQAAAKIPGVVVLQDSRDAAGRSGLALARQDAKTGVRLELVFDRTDFSYLGSRGVQVVPTAEVGAGTVVERTAVMERAVVDAKKQRPAPGRAG